MSGNRRELSAVSRREFLAAGLAIPAIAKSALAASTPAGETSTVSSTVLKIDLRRLVSRADLDYDLPASRSEEGTPIGNGKMGTLVWTTPDALHFQINRTDVHAVSCSTYSFPHGNTDYGAGCGYVDINFIDFGDDVFSAPAFHQHLSVYEALMTIRGTGVTAQILASNERDVLAIEIEDLRSHPAPMSIDLRMLRYAMQYVPHRNFELQQQHAVMVRTNAHMATSRLDIRNGRIVLSQTFEEDEFYCGSAVAIGITGRQAKARYLNESTVRLSTAPGNGRFTIYISSASSYARSEDVATMAVKEVDSAAATGFEILAASNQKWWHEFWSKGFVHLHSSDGVADYIEANYTYFLYVMGSSSRGLYPPRYGGMIWYTTGDMRMWGSEHWWENDGCYYEGLIPANRLELMDPLFKMFSGRFNNYAEAAVKQWGSKGIWLPATTWFDGLESLPDRLLAEMQQLYLMRKPWAERSDEFKRYALKKQTFNSRWNFTQDGHRWELGVLPRTDKGRGPFGHTSHIFSDGAKISYLYWLRYDVSRDKGFLREYGYPMLKAIAEFYRNFPNLRKGADGKYHIYHVNNAEGIWDAPDTQEELSAILGITPLAIRASQILGVDAELRPLWQELLENLAPLPTNEIAHVRQPGEPVVWVGAAVLDEPLRRPPVLGQVGIPTAFYDLCTIATDDANMLALGNATYDMCRSAGVNANTPCSVLQRDTVSAAKLGRIEHVRYLLPNLLRRLQPEKDDCDWVGAGEVAIMRNRFSLREGPGCITYERGGLACQTLHTALLMDSPPAPGQDSIIHVFAAWPREWDAEFTLAARGAFLVTSASKNGNVEFIELKSQAGGECNVRNPWVESSVALFRNGRQAEKLSGSLLKVSTAKGESILIVKNGETPSQIERTVTP